MIRIIKPKRRLIEIIEKKTCEACVGYGKIVISFDQNMKPITARCRACKGKGEFIV